MIVPILQIRVKELRQVEVNETYLKNTGSMGSSPSPTILKSEYLVILGFLYSWHFAVAWSVTNEDAYF